MINRSARHAGAVLALAGLCGAFVPGTQASTVSASGGGSTGLRDIGTVGNDTDSYVLRLTPDGRLIGLSYGSSGYHPFIYDTLGIHTVPTLGGSDVNYQSSNDAGQIVGQSATGGTYVQYGYNYPTYHAYLYSGGQSLDLGTLGGTNSYATFVTSSGKVFGQADTADTYASYSDLYDRWVNANYNYSEYFHYERSYSTTYPISHAFVYDSSGIHDIYPGTGPSNLSAWNDNGKAAGIYSPLISYQELSPTYSSDYGSGWYYYYYYVNYGSRPDYTHSRAFYFDGSATHDIGTLGGTYTSPTAINAGGKVVGNGQTASTYVQNNSTQTETHAFLYDGNIHDLGTLGGHNSYPTFVSDAGIVVGDSDVAANDTNGYPYSHAFYYDGDGMRDVGTLGGNASYVQKLTRSGKLIGVSETGVTNATFGRVNHVFVYDPATKALTDVGFSPDGPSNFTAVNDNDQIVGSAYTGAKDTSGNLIVHAFRYDINTRTMVDLGSLGGAYSSARAINNKGQIVGESATTTVDANNNPTTHAFVYDGTAMFDLGTLGGDYSSAQFLNEAGQVAGVSRVDTSGHQHVFVAIPFKPAPALTSLGSNAAGVGGPGFTLTVNGSNFDATTVAQWNGQARPTHFASATQLTVDIPASDLASGGSATVSVITAGPGGGTSNGLPFTVLMPKLTTKTSLVRDSVTNEIVVTVTVSNSGAADALQVQLTGASLSATPAAVSTTSSLPAAVSADIPINGSASVTVRFDGSVGNSGVIKVLRLNGTFTGGIFGGSSRAVLP